MIKQIVTFIEKHKSKYTVKLICRALQFPRSTYYKALVCLPSKRRTEADDLKAEILKVYTESIGRHGAPKIYKILKMNGKNISLKRVQRYMSAMEIRSIIVKKFRPCLSQASIEHTKANLLNRNFQATAINQKWRADITYINTVKDGWTYLASVMDLYSKKIIGMPMEHQ